MSDEQQKLEEIEARAKAHPPFAAALGIAEEDVPWLVARVRDRAAELTRLRSLLGRAAELADRATDWNLTEAEIFGEMVDVYELAREFRAASQGSDAG